MRTRSILPLAILALAQPLSAAAADDVLPMGRLMWSAFQCATYAGYAKIEKEPERLFNVGLKAGRVLVKAVHDGKFTNEQLSTSIPLGVKMRLGGPSVDFVVGVIYADASADAADDIIKKNDNGFKSLNSADWVFDKELQQMRGETEYLKSNCVLLK